MGEADLPRHRCALLLIDFINPLNFPGAEDLAPAALLAAKNSAWLARRARTEGIPVIYANDNFGLWRSDFSSMVKRLQAGQGPSAALVRLLRPRRGDLTLLKPMHSAFLGSPLDLLLGKMGTRRLIMTGLATDMCIQLSAADAFQRGLRVHAPEDCTAAESEARKQAALAYMRDILKCDTRAARTGGAKPVRGGDLP